MADNKDENEKKGGIVKIAIFVAAGLVLLGIGLGIAFGASLGHKQLKKEKSSSKVD